jgi:DNA topoisomerase-1
MGEALVIVESPAKAKTIEKFLGRDFKVAASLGHVRDLPKSQLGVNVDNDFEPKYITIRGKGKVLKKLRRAAKKADRVLLATDPDREGEAISWHLAKALKLDEDRPLRIAFNEITQQAVEAALEEPRPIDRKLVDAQQARRLLDRLVGYRLSPLLWRKVKRGLSAGRVQSVATRLVCDRQEEIDQFEPDEYWTVTVTLTPEDRDGEFEAKYYGPVGADSKQELPDRSTVDKLLSRMEDKPFTVAEVRKSERKRYPAPPFTTSSLQQEASRKLGFSVRKTMAVAQQLYEGLDVKGEGTVGLITYMRTDSTRVSGSAVGQTVALVRDQFGEEFSQPRSKRGNTEGAQDAHEAIRPTSVFRRPKGLKGDLNRDQYRLYRLIWKRFVASQMTPAVMDAVSVDIRVDDELFRSTGSSIKFPGFITLYQEEDDEDEQEGDDAVLAELEEEESLEALDIDPKQHFTKPPSRYTEASLVKTMEKLGIGRPSTYAPTIQTIQERGYVTRERKYLVPTELGKLVTDLLREHFVDIVDVQFTAELEDELDEIEEGRRDWRQVLEEFYWPFEETLEQAEEEIEKVELPVEETDVVCEKCGQNMVVKHGKYGKFLACPGFPECRNTKPYLEKTGVDCPDCDGEMVVRRTKKGRKFYGCNKYPDCEYTSWQKPLPHSCPECGAYLVERRSKSRGQYYSCSRETCDYTVDSLDELPAAEGEPEAEQAANGGE